MIYLTHGIIFELKLLIDTRWVAHILAPSSRSRYVCSNLEKKNKKGLFVLVFLSHLPVQSVTYLGSNSVELKTDKRWQCYEQSLCPSFGKIKKYFIAGLCARKSLVCLKIVMSEVLWIRREGMKSAFMLRAGGKMEIWEASQRRWHFELSLKKGPEEEVQREATAFHLLGKAPPRQIAGLCVGGSAGFPGPEVRGREDRVQERT